MYNIHQHQHVVSRKWVTSVAGSGSAAKHPEKLLFFGGKMNSADTKQWEHGTMTSESVTLPGRVMEMSMTMERSRVGNNMRRSQSEDWLWRKPGGSPHTGVRGGVEWKGGSPPLTPAEASPTHRSVREACLPHTPVEERPATRKEEEKPEHLYFQPFWLCKTLFILF